MDTLNLSAVKLTFVLCADLKVINCALGLMSHSSRYACAYRHWKNGSESTDCELRTFQGIRKLNEDWQNSGSEQTKLKNYRNCRSAPLDFFPNEGVFLDEIPLSELHLLIGLVNKLFTALVTVFPEAIKWPKKLLSSTGTISSWLGGQ